MKKIIAGILLKLWGWKIEGEIPRDKKLMVVVMHHTSNWDFVLAMLVRWKLGLNVSFVAKSSLFKPPLGYIMRYLGGYPVERNPAKKKGSVVQQIIDIINKHDKIWIGFTPEGTRDKVDKLKSGFYTIAKETGIKIVFVDFDYSTKTIRIDKPHKPAPSFEEELQLMKSFYKNSKGRYPEKSFDFDKINAPHVASPTNNKI